MVVRLDTFLTSLFTSANCFVVNPVTQWVGVPDGDSDKFPKYNFPGEEMVNEFRKRESCKIGTKANVESAR